MCVRACMIICMYLHVYDVGNWNEFTCCVIPNGLYC